VMIYVSRTSLAGLLVSGVWMSVCDTVLFVAGPACLSPLQLRQLLVTYCAAQFRCLLLPLHTEAAEMPCQACSALVQNSGRATLSLNTVAAVWRTQQSMQVACFQNAQQVHSYMHRCSRTTDQSPSVTTRS
jgi:hypothetical protein